MCNYSEYCISIQKVYLIYKLYTYLHWKFDYKVILHLICIEVKSYYTFKFNMILIPYSSFSQFNFIHY